MSKLIWKMIKAIVENSGAQRGTLFITDETSGALLISAEYYDEEMMTKRRRDSQDKGAHDSSGSGSSSGSEDEVSKPATPVLEIVKELGGDKKPPESPQKKGLKDLRKNSLDYHGKDITNPSDKKRSKDKARTASRASNSSGSEPGSGSDSDGALITVFADPQPLDKWENGPQSVVNFVCRTLQPALLTSACKDSRFGADAYIAKVLNFSVHSLRNFASTEPSEVCVVHANLVEK